MKLGKAIKEHPYYTFFVLLDVVLIAIVLFLLFRNMQSRVIVDFNVVPSMSKIAIDGVSYENGVFELDSGKKEVVVSADGFESKTYNVDFSEESIVKFYVFLIPENQNSDYYVKNPGDFLVAQSIGGEYVERIEKVLSIRNYLPLIDFKYGGLNGVSKEIVIDEDTTSECSKVLCLIVTGDKSENHIDTRELLKKKSLDIDDYGVRYVVH